MDLEALLVCVGKLHISFKDLHKPSHERGTPRRSLEGGTETLVCHERFAKHCTSAIFAVADNMFWVSREDQLEDLIQSGKTISAGVIMLLEPC